MTKDIFKDEIKYCVACASRNIKFWLTKKKVFVYKIFRCLSCGTAFLNPRPTTKYLHNIYKHSGSGLRYPITLENVLNREREYPNATVDAERLVKIALSLMKRRVTNKALDIGSGFGFFSQACVKYGFQVTAINPGKWENRIFEQLNDFKPVEKYFEDVKFNNKFDLIVISQVLEHLQEPESALIKVKKLLSPIGVLAIATPNINSFSVKILRSRDNSCLWVPEHLNYFSQKGLIKLLHKTGFSVYKCIVLSRIPYNFLSNRLKLQGLPRKICNEIIRLSQKLPLSLLDYLGLGLYINIWAKNL